MALAKILQRSENQFVGVASGLLDQFSVLMGRANDALQLDCRDFIFQRLPLGEPPPAIVICDSKTSRQLADGMYNKRHAECETVVAYFRSIRGDDAVHWLRDISLSDLAEHWDHLDPIGRLPCPTCSDRERARRARFNGLARRRPCRIRPTDE